MPSRQFPKPAPLPRPTDLDAFRALLTRFGLQPTAEIRSLDGAVEVKLEAQDPLNGDKVQGYTGFSMDWQFDATGTFVKVGVWE